MKLSEGYTKISALQSKIENIMQQTKESRNAFRDAAKQLCSESKVVTIIFDEISYISCRKDGKIEFIIRCCKDDLSNYWKQLEENDNKEMELENLLNRYAPEKVTVEKMYFFNEYDSSYMQRLDKVSILISFKN